MCESVCCSCGEQCKTVKRICCCCCWCCCCVAVVAGRKLLHLAVQICPALISPKHMALVAPFLSSPLLFSTLLYLYLFQFIFYFFLSMDLTMSLKRSATCEAFVRQQSVQHARHKYSIGNQSNSCTAVTATTATATSTATTTTYNFDMQQLPGGSSNSCCHHHKLWRLQLTTTQ